LPNGNTESFLLRIFSSAFDGNLPFGNPDSNQFCKNIA
jgi:hypothetical protein